MALPLAYVLTAAIGILAALAELLSRYKDAPVAAAMPHVDWDILDASQMRALIRAELHGRTTPPVGGRRPTVGLVGYPNVGKSSTVNVLMREKKTAVSATPGKTKRIQTLFLGEDLCLCDCPGMVFPSFSATKADMVLNGVLPIDQLRDFRAPAALLLQRIPGVVYEST